MKNITKVAYFSLALLAVGVSLPSSTLAARINECPACDQQCPGAYGSIDPVCVAKCSCATGTMTE